MLSDGLYFTTEANYRNLLNAQNHGSINVSGPHMEMINSSTQALDSLDRFTLLSTLIHEKGSLKLLYQEVYARYGECLRRCPKEGLMIEIGSGAGFVKDSLPEVMTTDVMGYPGIDKIVDATQMPFQDASVSAFFLNNVLHHIPDPSQFFTEANRTLKPGGRILIEDHSYGWLSKLLLQYVHHEPYNPHSREWQFTSSGPLSGANTALAWIIFNRDRSLFTQKFPNLKIVREVLHTPLRYWLVGGLKNWSLLPKSMFHWATKLDALLVKLHPLFGSWVTIEIEKIK